MHVYFAMAPRLLVSAFALVVLAGCAATQEQGMTKSSASLYDRLGGKPAITAVVDEFIAGVAADARINRFFAKTDIPKLKRLRVEQICEAAGGPCKYSGRDMKSSHEGLGISSDHFGAMGEDLVKALDKFNVPPLEKDELMKLLGSMKGDIVEG